MLRNRRMRDSFRGCIVEEFIEVIAYPFISDRVSSVNACFINIFLGVQRYSLYLHDCARREKKNLNCCFL